ncbi:MAG: hypothetical protein LUD73_03490 [Lachnospiraceae bacterium]|nr:hypothetical protein [Lachnospiraceae bacterium]
MQNPKEDAEMNVQAITQMKLPCRVELLDHHVKVYTGAGYEYVPAGSVTKMDCPEIDEVREGKKSALWGHLKSGAGWIPLDQVKMISEQ